MKRYNVGALQQRLDRDGLNRVSTVKCRILSDVVRQDWATKGLEQPDYFLADVAAADNTYGSTRQTPADVLAPRSREHFPVRGVNIAEHYYRERDDELRNRPAVDARRPPKALAELLHRAHVNLVEAHAVFRDYSQLWESFQYRRIDDLKRDDRLLMTAKELDKGFTLKLGAGVIEGGIRVAREQLGP
jgi:hypothetical protein